MSEVEPPQKEWLPPFWEKNMADGFGYSGYYRVPYYPFWIPPPYPHPPASTPPFPATHPVQSSYDQTQGGSDPMIPPSYYTQPDNFSLRSEDFPPLTPPSSSSFYAQPVNFDSCKDMGGYYPSMESDANYYPPPMARQRLVWAPYSSSATVSSYMLNRNSREPFYMPVPPTGLCAPYTNAYYPPGHYYSGYESMNAAAPPPVEPYLPVPSMPMSSLNTDASSDGSTGSWRPLPSQPLQFDAKSPGSLYTEKGEASGVSSRPNTLVADSENGSSLKNNTIGDLNCGESLARPSAQLGVSYRAPPQGSALEDVKGSLKLQDQLVDIMNKVKKTTSSSTDLSIKGSSLSNADGVSTGQSPSPAYSPRVSTVVNAMHTLSEVLVNECFNKGSLLKPEQFEKLDKLVEKLAKCLKKITCKQTKAGDASDSTQAMHVSCPNVVHLNESIKSILASNFPDGEENHPKTLLYKNLWLQAEAALCSSTCLARYHRIKNETGNLKLQGKEISADASTLKQDPFLNPEESNSILNIVEQEATESLIKDGQENHGNFKPAAQIPDTIQQDSPASTTEEKHNDVIERFQTLKQQETKLKLKSEDFLETRMDEQEDNPDASEMATIGRSSHMSDAMGRFQMVKRRESEQVQKSLNSVDFDSDSGSDFDSDSDSDNDQPRNKTQMYDYLLSGSMMAIGGNSKIETCAGTEPSADGKGYESPTSDWEYILKDD